MKKLLTIISFSCILAALASCNKDAEEFNGRWQLTTAPVTAYDYFWSFEQTDTKEGFITIYTTDTVTGESDTCSTGDFFIKNSVVTVGAPVAFCQWSTYDGEWEILKLDKEFMTLIRYLPRGTIYLEFVKRN